MEIVWACKADADWYRWSSVFIYYCTKVARRKKGVGSVMLNKYRLSLGLFTL